MKNELYTLYMLQFRSTLTCYGRHVTQVTDDMLYELPCYHVTQVTDDMLYELPCYHVQQVMDAMFY